MPKEEWGRRRSDNQPYPKTRGKEALPSGLTPVPGTRRTRQLKTSLTANPSLFDVTYKTQSGRTITRQVTADDAKHAETVVKWTSKARGRIDIINVVPVVSMAFRNSLSHEKKFEYDDYVEDNLETMTIPESEARAEEQMKQEYGDLLYHSRADYVKLSPDGKGLHRGGSIDGGDVDGENVYDVGVYIEAGYIPRRRGGGSLKRRAKKEGEHFIGTWSVQADSRQEAEQHAFRIASERYGGTSHLVTEPAVKLRVISIEDDMMVTFHAQDESGEWIE